MPATEEYWRSLPATHKVFAASSLALLAVTVWMMAADHDDEWRVYQSQFQTHQAEKLKATEKRIETPAYNAGVKDLQDKIAAVKTDLAQLKAARDKVDVVHQQVLGDFARADLETKTAKAQQGVDRANYDLAVRDNLPQAEQDRLHVIFGKTRDDVGKLELNLQQVTALRDALKRRDQAAIKHHIEQRVAEPKNVQEGKRFDRLLGELLAEVEVKNADGTVKKTQLESLREMEAKESNDEAALKKLELAFNQAHKALTRIEPESSLSSYKRKSMEWVILDGFNSHLKIQQDWVPGLTINYGGMKDVARFDRCRTCHQGIDMEDGPGIAAFPADKYKQPFSTHPRTDLYLTDASPHPVGKFGCTICHEGQGSGTSFQNASHTPNSPDIAHKWEPEHKWAHNHFWEFPMSPERFKESGCLKCHHSVVELGINPKFGATAPKLFEGYNIIRQYGCFGCHEINGYDGVKPIGPDFRLEPSVAEAEKIKGDPNARPGAMRKVGPALTHIGDKTTSAWTEFWTLDPQNFRPETRMPRFFNLDGQIDAHNAKLTPVEISSLVHYLFDKSVPNKLLSPAQDYQADAERGKLLFSQRGCLACHTHTHAEKDASGKVLTVNDFAGTAADFGPDLGRINEKVLPGEKGRDWLYTWIRNPQMHHPRSKMPNLYLEPYQEAGKTIDPAADIAAFLQTKGKGEALKYDALAMNKGGLNELAVLYLSKVLTKEQVDQVMNPAGGYYPETNKDYIKGDEIELFTGQPGDDNKLTEKQFLNYVGRRTISRYGCYGCHEIKGFENARPIGTALQNWGRKGKSKLAVEHIAEYLHHHGEPDGSSTYERAQHTMELAVNGGFSDPELQKRETSHAYFYEQISHGERAGFLWQKLRAPRSYDFKKIETKNFDERLRMPKFPFNEEQIEAVSTFVLGLVAEPPSEKYLYQPQGRAKARVEGEKLLTKYNCAGCHVLELPKVQYWAEDKALPYYELKASDHQSALDLLLTLKPPREARTGKTRSIDVPKNERKDPLKPETREFSEITFHGLLFSNPDPEETDQSKREYGYDLWETLKFGEKLLVPGERMNVLESERTDLIRGSGGKPGRGGEFAEWLVQDILKASKEPNPSTAWQSSPPPLYLEGIKVQTPWLYDFLKNPIRLRHTTVLRMPQFNMTDAEAMTLANYFAAVDGAEYPYQNVPQRDADYIAAKDAAHPQYLPDGWQTFKACVQCHSVGGLEYQVSPPTGTGPQKDFRGPNLVNVADRLRPDWTMLWLYNPKWITPYTSMPAKFARDKKENEELFGGDGNLQAVAVRDALMNYHRLTESQPKLVRPAPAPAAAASKPGDAK